MPKLAYLYSDAASTDDWYMQSDGNSNVQGTLDDILASAHEDTKFCLLLPGTDISLFDVSLPEKNQRKFIDSIGYTLEDQLAEDINDIHITSLINTDNKAAAISCINKQKLSTWLSCSSSSNELITSALPIAIVLPTHADGITVVVTDTLTHVKITSTTGYSIESNLVASLLLSSVLSDAENKLSQKSPAIHCYDITTNDSLYTKLCEELTNGGALIVDHGKLHSILDLDLTAASDCGQGNILHGEYTVKSQSSLTNYWKTAAIFVALFLCIEASNVLIQKSRLESQMTITNDAIETIFRTTFPDIKRVVDPKIQMRNGINELKAEGLQHNSTFIHLLTQTASVLSSTPGIKISGYRFKNNQLTYDITANSIEHVSNAQKSLSRSKDINAKLINARTENKRVTGQVEVELSS